MISYIRTLLSCGKSILTGSNSNYIKLSNAEGVLTHSNNIPLIFPASDKVQLNTILSKGNYQFVEFKSAISYLRENSLLKGNLFIDIGANVGTHTLYALQEPEFKHALAVEPSQSNLYYLKSNLLLNKAENLVTVIPAAIGDKNTKSRLVKNPRNCGDYRVEPNAASEKNLFGEKNFLYESINMITLDHLLDPIVDKEDIAFIWIDTQGSEGLILGESKKILETKVPIYIEFWPYGMDKLNAYPLLRKIITSEVKLIVRFIDDVAHQFTPEYIDTLYQEFKGTGEFCDLLLIR